MHIFEGGGVRVGRPCLRPCSHNFSPPRWTVVIWDLGFYDKGKGSMWEASENFVNYVGVREGWCKNKQAHVCGPSPHPYATLTHTHTYTHNTHTQILGQSIEYRLCYQVCLDSRSQTTAKLFKLYSPDFLTCEKGGYRSLFLRIALKIKLQKKSV